MLFFFFKQKPAYDLLISDWSSDVCSSDLIGEHEDEPVARRYLPRLFEPHALPARGVGRHPFDEHAIVERDRVRGEGRRRREQSERQEQGGPHKHSHRSVWSQAIGARKEISG